LEQVTLGTDGQSIEMHFDRAIDPQTIVEDEFHLYMGNEVNFDSIGRISADSLVYSMYITDTIKYRQYASLIYDGQTAATIDSALVPFFGPETVENNMPGFRFAETDSTGAFVTVGFSEEMEPDIPFGEFTIKANDVTIPISSAEYDAEGNVVFTLAQDILYGQQITLTYTKGTYTTSAGYMLYSFSPKYVQNNVKDEATGVPDIDISKLKIYPNPASKVLNIDGLTKGCTVKVYSVNGQAIELNNQVVQNNRLSIGIEHLPAGMYICKILDNKGKLMVTKEFIKN
jgi:hypothetical protein